MPRARSIPLYAASRASSRALWRTPRGGRAPAAWEGMEGKGGVIIARFVVRVPPARLQPPAARRQSQHRTLAPRLRVDSGGGLGIHGLSYGAWNAYSALASRPDLFAVGVGVSGVSPELDRACALDGFTAAIASEK